MKRTSIFASAGLLSFVLGLFALPMAGRAADAKKPAAAAPTDTVTNESHAVFDIKAASVKDPFFPLSTRSAVPVAVVTNVAPALLGPKDFHLMGKSGTDDAPLVIINDHSFAPGEKAFVVPWGAVTKVGVTVIAIKDYSAIIQVDGLPSPLEISLSKDFR